MAVEVEEEAADCSVAVRNRPLGPRRLPMDEKNMTLMKEGMVWYIVRQGGTEKGRTFLRVVH